MYLHKEETLSRTEIEQLQLERLQKTVKHCMNSTLVEYGINRIICSEPSRAYTTLKDAGISVALSDVFALTLDNVPGRAADAVRILSEEGIGITYMYSFLLGGKGILIFRTDNPERTREVIILNDLSFISDKDLSLKT